MSLASLHEKSARRPEYDPRIWDRMPSAMNIAIIGGSGHLGLWYARRLRAAGHAVTITGRNRAKLEAAARSAGVTGTTDNQAAIRSAEVVVVSVPLDAAADLIDLAVTEAPTGALVVDLASVKSSVAQAYQRVVRQDLELASLHPLHGPRMPSLAGVTVLTIPLRVGPRYQELRRFLVSEGAQAVVTDAAQHDRDMALLQGLTHFVAIAAGRTLADQARPAFETPAHALLRTTIARVVLQDPALYAAIQLENPNNAAARRSFLETARYLAELAERGDAATLQSEIARCAGALGDGDEELADSDACVLTLTGRRPAVETTRVAVLGPPGTFSDVALRAYGRMRGERFSPVYVRTIPEVFESVRAGDVAAGIVPVENMIEGTIAVTLDRLFDTGLRIVSELLIPVHQSISALPGNWLGSLKRVLSIPPALAQVQEWLRTNVPQAKIVETSSTAEAIDQVARLRYEGDAAIGLAATAEAAGLEVLARDIEDEKENVTRFLVIGAKDTPRTGHDRTSLCVHDVPNKPGVLDHILQVLALRGLNLSKIESRPTRKRIGTYQFYIDVEGHREDSALRSAMDDLAKECSVTVLGSYPRAF
jgi:prephenate dehydratase/prephenate dehydrogenase